MKKKAFRYPLLIIAVLCGLLHMSIRESHGAPDGDMTRQIKDAYTEGNYTAAAGLLEKSLVTLNEEVSKGGRRHFFNLYRQTILLGYIYAWKLNNHEAALKAYQDAIALRQSHQAPSGFPPFDLLYIAELYEVLNDFPSALTYYREILDSAQTLRSAVNDTESLMIMGYLTDLIKYRIDGINLKSKENGKAPLLEKVKLSGISPQMVMLFAYAATAVSEYDYAAVRKNGLAHYIETSPANVSAMILNFGFVIAESADSVGDTAEKAFEAYLVKYPDSYYSLYLRYFFCKYFRENGQPGKAERLEGQLKTIARQRGIEIITGPDRRFSSPESTWETFKGALISGDIDTVMECYVPGVPLERGIFSSMSGDQLREMAADMGEIGKITGDDRKAVYGIKRTYNGKDLSFTVDFFNVDGEWKMNMF